MQSPNPQQPKPTLYNWSAAPKIKVSLEKPKTDKWSSLVLRVPLLALSNGNLVSGNYKDERGTIQVWDTQTGVCLQTLKHSNSSIRGLAELPNGYFASSHHNQAINIWDPQAGVLVKTLHKASSFDNAGGTLAVTPNGYLVSVKDGTIKVWNTETGQCLQTLKGSLLERIDSLAVLSDNKLACGSLNIIKIWDWKTKKLLHTIKAHFTNILAATLVNALVVFPNGYLVSGGDDKTIKIWDPQTWQCVRTLGGHDGSIYTLAALPDYKLASGSGDGTIKIWDIQTGKCLQTIEPQQYGVSSLALLPSGRLASNAIAIYSFPESQPELTTPTEPDHQLTVLNTFQSILLKPETLTLDALEDMMALTPDLYTFRFPYTLANMLRRLSPQDSQAIDALLFKRLKQVAEQFIVSSECVAFYKLLLRSAFHKGIIDRKQKYELDNIAESTKIFSDTRFLELKGSIQKLQTNVDTLQQNVQALATDLTDFKVALKNRAKRDMVFGVAKVALAFIGSQIIDIFAAIADFSDFAEIGSVLFKQPVELVETNLASGKTLLLEAATEKALQKAGLSPDTVVEVWSETALVLQPSPSTAADTSHLASTSSTIAIDSAPAMKESKQEQDKISASSANLPVRLVSAQVTPSSSTSSLSNNPTSFFSPKSTGVTNQSPIQDALSVWLEEAKQYGHFSITLDAKDVKISFESAKAEEEIEAILMAFDEKLVKLLESQKITIEDRDIEGNCLIITTKAKLDAKKISNFLEKQYQLTTSNQEPQMGIAV